MHIEATLCLQGTGKTCKRMTMHFGWRAVGTQSYILLVGCFEGSFVNSNKATCALNFLPSNLLLATYPEDTPPVIQKYYA